MIDIRAVVNEIVKARKASSEDAYRAFVHGQIREYGSQLLLCLHQAITATTQDEVAIVAWLKNQLVEQAQQIPQAKE